MLDLQPVRAFLSDHHLALASEVSRFTHREITTLPNPPDDATARIQARVILAKLGGAGFFRVAHPLDLRACCLLREALGRASPLADEVFALQCLGSLPIALGGSESLVSS